MGASLPVVEGALGCLGGRSFTLPLDQPLSAVQKERSLQALVRRTPHSRMQRGRERSGFPTWERVCKSVGARKFDDRRGRRGAVIVLLAACGRCITDYFAVAKATNLRELNAEVCRGIAQGKSPPAGTSCTRVSSCCRGVSEECHAK